MRKLLNTLYVTNPNSYLARDGENVVVRVDDRPVGRVPIHNLESIITFGYTGASPALMHLCAERGVSISFHRDTGQFLARVQGPIKGNVLLRRQQYKMADGTEAVQVARNMIFAKVANSRVILNRGLRDHELVINSVKVRQESELLKRYLGVVVKLATLDDIRGLEGDAARRYFRALNELILVNKDDFFIRTRNRRPPLDRMNAMLSFMYGLLRNDVQSALESVGLDPQVGFLHRDRPGRPSLALDMMEELRGFLVDRLVVSMVNRKQVDPSQFVQKENGAVLLKPSLRKELIAAWQKRKHEEITHPFLEEKIPLGLLPYAQALLLARYIRGDLDAYPPFLWK
jgi:CRISPR-associated endonuclease Cas1